ncbi:hypothetical protein PHMEG_00022706, partial [Phytophthora megakarya]
SNLSTLKNAVCTAVEKILQLTDKLEYEVMTSCVQMYYLSCGIVVVSYRELH